MLFLKRSMLYIGTGYRQKSQIRGESRSYGLDRSRTHLLFLSLVFDSLVRTVPAELHVVCGEKNGFFPVKDHVHHQDTEYNEGRSLERSQCSERRRRNDKECVLGFANVLYSVHGLVLKHLVVLQSKTKVVVLRSVRFGGAEVLLWDLEFSTSRLRSFVRSRIAWW